MSTDGGPLDTKRKAQEEEYFRKQNDDHTAKIKLKKALEAMGISGDELKTNLIKAGYNEDTARALFLVPLIDVAWADGKIQQEERATLLQMIEGQGIEPDSQAYRLLMNWIDSRPEDSHFQEAVAIFKPVIDELKSSHSAKADWLIHATREVAASASGLFGFGSKISAKEEEVLRDLTGRLS